MRAPGVPIDVLIARPDIAYRDKRNGSIYANPLVVRRAGGYDRRSSIPWAAATAATFGVRTSWRAWIPTCTTA